MEYFPRIVSWNITSACNLRCAHCYLDAGRLSPGELSTKEGLGLIDQMAEAGTKLLILTGGEPLLRRDLPILSRYATGKGITVVLGTSGTLMTRDKARLLKESGISAAGISVDSLDPVTHDTFRGLKGAWQRASDGIDACREEGLDFLVHTTALKMNQQEIPKIVQFAYEKGARAFHLFFLVCTGRGEQLTDLSPQEYQTLLEFILNVQSKYPGMMVRARCAPYIGRLASQSGTSLQWSSGCLAGTSYCRVSPTGDVTPCPYLPAKAGNVRERSFQDIWDFSPALTQFRYSQLRLEGKCGKCAFSRGDNPICVGCRARAFALTGDTLAEDPWCLLDRGQMEHPSGTSSEPQEEMLWTEEALERIKRVPLFIRARVKGAAEAYARQHGLTSITPELLDRLRSQAYPGTSRREVQ